MQSVWGKYQGETDRPLNSRTTEHIRAPKNPQKYSNNALGHHYRTLHSNYPVYISVALLDTQRTTLKRKLSEALFVHGDNLLPNEKSELESV